MKVLQRTFKSLCKAFSLRTQTALANHRCVTTLVKMRMSGCSNVAWDPLHAYSSAGPPWLARDLG